MMDNREIANILLFVPLYELVQPPLSCCTMPDSCMKAKFVWYKAQTFPLFRIKVQDTINHTTAFKPAFVIVRFKSHFHIGTDI
jgi:hypothetical protein